MWVIMAACLSYITLVVLQFILNLIYHRFIMLKDRLDLIEKQSLYGYSKKSKKDQKKEKQSISIEVPEKLKENLLMAGINLRPDEFLKMWLGLAAFAVVICVALDKGLIVTLFAFAAALIGPPMYIKIKRKQRISKFSQQLGDALLILSNSLRAGFTFEQALASIAKDLPDPIGPEFLKVCREVELGENIEKSLAAVSTRMESEEMKLMNTAVSIQRQVGGNLADVLDNIGEAIRERITIQKNIKALTAQGDASAKVIAGLPIVVLVLISMVNKEYMEPVFTTPFGYALLGVSATLEIMGYAMIKKLTNIEM